MEQLFLSRLAETRRVRTVFPCVLLCFSLCGFHVLDIDTPSGLILEQPRARRELERADYPVPRHPEYRYATEFQSHEPEVRCLA